MIHNKMSFIFLLMPQGAEDVSVVLTSNLTEDWAFHRQKVLLTCIAVVEGNDTLITWSSRQYIGAGGEVLQLLSTYSSGYTVRSRQNRATVATLVNTTRNNRTVTTISELQLIASGLHPSSRVSCRANGHEPAIITFRKLDIEFAYINNNHVYII